MKALEKRKARSYKIADTPYKRALKRGKKEDAPLANLLERVVELYAAGWNIAFFDKNCEYASKIEIDK